MIAVVTKNPPQEKDSMIRYLRYGESIVGVGFDRIIVVDSPKRPTSLLKDFNLWVDLSLKCRLNNPDQKIVRLDI